MSLGGVVQTVGALAIKEGGCPVTLERRAGCVSMQDGEKWNVQEVITACGDIKYFDPDVSPAKDVTALVAAWLYAGPCDCCDQTSLVLPPLKALQIYGSAFVGAGGANNKFATGAISWTIKIHKNHAPVFTSPASPVFSSAASAQTWVDAIGGGGYITSSGVWSSGSIPGLNVPDTADVWTVCFEETDALSATSGWSANQGYGFTNDPVIVSGFGCAAGNWMSGLSNGLFITDANIANYATLCLP